MARQCRHESADWDSRKAKVQVTLAQAARMSRGLSLAIKQGGSREQRVSPDAASLSLSLHEDLRAINPSDSRALERSIRPILDRTSTSRPECPPG